jgi:hypothetical protein
MLIETALMTYLLAQTFVATYLTGADGTKRIYFVVAPQEVAKPYIVITKIDSPRDHSHDGGTGLANPRFQLSVFSTTYGEAKSIAAAIQAVLQGYVGMMGGAGGVDVFNSVYEDETDLDPGEMGLFGVAVDYKFWHRE